MRRVLVLSTLLGLACGGGPPGGLPPLRRVDGAAAVPWCQGSPDARLEAAVAQDCKAAPVSRVAVKWGLAPATVWRIDKRALQHWAASRRRKPVR